MNSIPRSCASSSPFTNRTGAWPVNRPRATPSANLHLDLHARLPESLQYRRRGTAANLRSESKAEWRRAGTAAGRALAGPADTRR
ncbi:hypothetical protein FOMPIDRAFT_1047920 [Fomitopsis schrenkii]|uniref:Uncharacterized protein n=1 Tax=Fomitopsis schrenkii TaxID=2126942 RepID=S8EGA9_FOMSC|nr:hypothetical protein FOMPIDRAFT_1047920 [Fomitopsis schrenkii]